MRQRRQLHALLGTTNAHDKLLARIRPERLHRQEQVEALGQRLLEMQLHPVGLRPAPPSFRSCQPLGIGQHAVIQRRVELRLAHITVVRRQRHQREVRALVRRRHALGQLVVADHQQPVFAARQRVLPDLPASRQHHRVDFAGIDMEARAQQFTVVVADDAHLVALRRRQIVVRVASCAVPYRRIPCPLHGFDEHALAVQQVQRHEYQQPGDCARLAVQCPDSQYRGLHREHDGDPAIRFVQPQRDDFGAVGQQEQVIGRQRHARIGDDHCQQGRQQPCQHRPGGTPAVARACGDDHHRQDQRKRVVARMQALAIERAEAGGRRGVEHGQPERGAKHQEGVEHQPAGLRRHFLARLAAQGIVDEHGDRQGVDHRQHHQVALQAEPGRGPQREEGQAGTHAILCLVAVEAAEYLQGFVADQKVADREPGTEDCRYRNDCSGHPVYQAGRAAPLGPFHVHGEQRQRRHQEQCVHFHERHQAQDDAGRHRIRGPLAERARQAQPGQYRKAEEVHRLRHEVGRERTGRCGDAQHCREHRGGLRCNEARGKVNERRGADKEQQVEETRAAEEAVAACGRQSKRRQVQV
ncbi:hypothetical protein D3872_12485 [Massilia cavernae]|uniref:Uncharacterized protein n=1 Tax=Massilia cavernae TaxID=2320864 RepID=A0A418XSW6_9BURK|nr:hypothetical protein [Massilia cavernae]RJG15716.1 hypothetical protein D3872_12485 [Massilia cavernae]